MNPVNHYDVIVIGGGKGGKTLAMDLGGRGIKTALIERSPEMIGGSCINVACIPTKTLIASARALHAARNAATFGVRTGEVAIDWPAVRRRAEAVVASMRAMNQRNFTSVPALDFIVGTARFLEPHVVELREASGAIRRLAAEKIFINTGTRPAMPAIPGLAGAGALTSESIQRLERLPSHLIVLGGSYVGLEFAQMFRRFGCEVSVIERGPQILRHEDADVAAALTALLRAEGIAFSLNAAVQHIDRDDGNVVVTLADGKGTQIRGSHVLASLGRTPNTEELNLGAANVKTDPRGFVAVNERLETSTPGIWALGDVNGGPQFTHASLDDYRIVHANVFAGGQRSTRDRLVPFTLFTEPELARVGLTEREAVERGATVRIAKQPISAIPRAKTASETRGFMKVVIDAATERILGCAILSIEAGEMIAAPQLAMVAGQPFTVLRDTIWAHPTLVEGFNTAFAAR